MIALILVILIVYLFLHDWRATLIPSISIIVSLIGTFAFLYAVGFTLNMLTLFAIVLVIGTVVDDSVVVVEAVQARFDDGEKNPYRATVSAMGGLSAALITTTIVLWRYLFRFVLWAELRAHSINNSVLQWRSLSEFR